ncbi:hypothetical protein PHLGIDRAFT_123266 [Phlebiopsis gigantea 11061_1 CR5-6]|uniref:Hydrophobin n=1 Tax=Phlebiopsis gigantea (strain 11061_1 CR5-6) TaxID=745531 RepID=A0A0C3NAK9_PHLG1|nr:hypothetical protein PHLGIDRAFT_123266 [Phlebiopsis gigantea 11061_1 CR5-6]
MARFSGLVAFAALATAASAGVIARDPSVPSACQGPSVALNTTIGAGVQLTTFNCESLQTAPSSADTVTTSLKEDLVIVIPFPIFPFPLPKPKPKPTTSHVTSTSSAPVATPTADVCNELCTNSCGSIGDLPPISEDCQQIFNSITILQGSIAPTFTVESNQIQQLTFGTCRVFFENFSNETVSECWSTLSNVSEAAGTQCFPPTQPVNSAGFCSPSDASWQIGIAHS